MTRQNLFSDLGKATPISQVINTSIREHNNMPNRLQALDFL